MVENNIKYKLRYDNDFAETDLKKILSDMKLDFYNCEDIDNYKYEIIFYMDSEFKNILENYEQLDSYKEILSYFELMKENINEYKSMIDISISELEKFLYGLKIQDKTSKIIPEIKNAKDEE